MSEVTDQRHFTEDSQTSIEEENFESFQMIFAAVSWKNSVGCAYYDTVNGSLYLMEDAQSISGQEEFLSMIIEQVSPQVVLVSSKAEESLLSCLEKSRERSGDQKSSQLVIRPSRDFSSSSGASALAKIGKTVPLLLNSGSQNGSIVESHGREIKPDENWSGNPTLTARSLINTEASQLSLSALAALVAYLNKRTMHQHDDDEPSEDGIRFTSVEMIRVEKFLHIGSDALRSLQIFDQEAHANLHSNKTKEGLSLYGILNECVTYSGRMLLKNWLIRPTTQIEIISARANAVQCFLESDNEHCAGRMRQYLKSTGNLARTIMIISSGKGRVGEWRAVLNFMRAAVNICEESNSFVDSDLNIALISRISNSEYTSELNEQAKKIDLVIDWQESKINGGRVIVKSGIDDELDELRENYAGLESQLDHLAGKLSAETPFLSAPDFSIVYFPQIGYLCRVPRNSDHQQAEEPFHDGWEFQFTTDTHSHYKNEHMRDLDHYIGDLTTSITVREIEIVTALEAALAIISPILLNLASDMAELDCLLSLAKIAHLREWVRPEIVEENMIEIEGGRHPLVEACVEIFIENDTYMVGGKGLGSEEDINMSIEEEGATQEIIKPHSMIVLTGANFSGKSVYLKQVAMIIILSQIGSYIPAKKAKIGIHDAIFTRVTSTESSSRNSSAFMIDLQQVSFMLRNCTRRSLLLLDEFGKGTDPIDGQAIFCSVVEHLIRRGTECPKTILSTHFHAVFSNGSMAVGLPINYCHMSIILSNAANGGNPKRSTSDLEPTYLYKLSPGLVTSSHALGCAALFGAPIHVRLRAQGVSEALSKHEMLELIDNGISDDKIQELDRLEGIVRRFLMTDFGEPENANDERMDEDQDEVMRHLKEVILQADDVVMNE